jgi:DNA-binding response OmpR family regulator
LSSQNEKFQTLIEIQEKEKNIILNVNGSKKKFIIPIDINILAAEISKKIMNINIQILDYKYFPYQRLITNIKKKSLLSDIQNTIMSKLLIYKEGIDKEGLYQSIWKRDKEVSINKLDTHLTNLKNQLKSDLDLYVNFQSQNKILRLLID